MSFIPTLDLLSALKIRLAALELSPGVKAFEQVEYYSQPRLIQALQDLRLFKNRVCLIVPDDDVYEHSLEGRVLDTHCLRSVILLFADRDVGRRQDASTGDPSGTPGVIKLNQLVVDDLLGHSLGFDEGRVRPDVGGPILIEGKDREHSTGREAWHLDLTIEAGTAITTHDP